MKSGKQKPKTPPKRRMEQFKEKYAAKYPTAWERLEKDSDVLLSFYDFPAEHWWHIRTTNPIESAFATIRLRHRRTKGSGSRRTSLAMMFKLGTHAEKRWRRLNGHQLITHLLEGKNSLTASCRTPPNLLGWNGH